MNAALMASAQGDWIRAEEILRGLVATNPGDFVVSRSLSFFHYSFPSFRPLISVSLHPHGTLIWEKEPIPVPFRSEARPRLW